MQRSAPHQDHIGFRLRISNPISQFAAAFGKATLKAGRISISFEVLLRWGPGEPVFPTINEGNNNLGKIFIMLSARTWRLERRQRTVMNLGPCAGWRREVGCLESGGDFHAVQNTLWDLQSLRDILRPDIENNVRCLMVGTSSRTLQQ